MSLQVSYSDLFYFAQSNVSEMSYREIQIDVMKWRDLGLSPSVAVANCKRVFLEETWLNIGIELALNYTETHTTSIEDEDTFGDEDQVYVGDIDDEGYELVGSDFDGHYRTEENDEEDVCDDYDRTQITLVYASDLTKNFYEETLHLDDDDDLTEEERYASTKTYTEKIYYYASLQDIYGHHNAMVGEGMTLKTQKFGTDEYELIFANFQ